MLQVLGQRPAQVMLIDDQHLVEELPPEGVPCQNLACCPGLLLYALRSCSFASWEDRPQDPDLRLPSPTWYPKPSSLP